MTVDFYINFAFLGKKKRKKGMNKLSLLSPLFDAGSQNKQDFILRGQDFFDPPPQTKKNRSKSGGKSCNSKKNF